MAGIKLPENPYRSEQFCVGWRKNLIASTAANAWDSSQQATLKWVVELLEAKKIYHYALINGQRKEDSYNITLTNKDIVELKQLIEDSK
jgi:hypothetical protein